MTRTETLDDPIPCPRAQPPDPAARSRTGRGARRVLRRRLCRHEEPGARARSVVGASCNLVLATITYDLARLASIETPERLGFGGELGDGPAFLRGLCSGRRVLRRISEERQHEPCRLRHAGWNTAGVLRLFRHLLQHRH